ncbi:UNKNOWN [Stylonychia lemnae]|uniref:C2HC/C3H-type domain-containing protein n=1 Tax=Stylonychia lemnae TaxID=5949 RepID=A0A078AG93_STYLE|nr:UNKNOWN [Stylonychia lemnae]|eukprot:CDW80851.1 UNKNOWN [Stylonychia lemnae]
MNNYYAENGQDDEYDEEGFRIEKPPLNLKLVKSNLQLLKQKIQIKEQPGPYPPSDEEGEVVYDESTMNHENPGTYHNNFYRKVFVPQHLKSFDVSQWNPNDPYRQLKYANSASSLGTQSAGNNQRQSRREQFNFGSKLLEKLAQRKSQLRASMDQNAYISIREHGEENQGQSDEKIDRARDKLRRLNRQKASGEKDNDENQYKKPKIRLPPIKNVKNQTQNDYNEEQPSRIKKNLKSQFDAQEPNYNQKNMNEAEEDGDWDNKKIKPKGLRFDIAEQEEEEQPLRMPPIIPKKSKIIEKVQNLQKQKQNKKGNQGGGTGADKAKNTKWRQKSEQFRSAMKAARGGGVSDTELAAQYDDRKQCPNCKRKFNELAAEKHIRMCNQKHRAKGVKVF